MNATPRNLRLLSGSAKTVARRSYATYRSPYGPKYDVPLNVQGWTVKSFVNLGTTLAGFGGVAGFFALFFFSDVPRVRRDIMQRVPILGEYWVKEVHPADNPF